ncbi:MAG: hypothetical protein ACJATP_001200, partial [Candidatus Azotimanducaceae bacterium]
MKIKTTGAGLTLTVLLMGCSPAAEDVVVATQTVPEIVEPAPAVTTEPVATSFIAAEFNAPTLVEAEGFKLVPLGPELVKIDFDAYMSSIEHLQKTFTRNTGWPNKDITDADALLDMQTEQTRFENRESFAYAVLTPDGSRERGSVYVYPSTIEGYDAVVKMWVTKAEYDAGFDAELYAWATHWVQTDWSFEKVAYPGRAIGWESWDALVAVDTAAKAALEEENRLTAEGFIDAFYSFDPEQLKPFLANAEESAPRLSYYQGWAEGGHYKVLNRGACTSESPTLFQCPITVQDDPVVELKTGFNVTDTFHLTFDATQITSIKTSSDDQPI